MSHLAKKFIDSFIILVTIFLYTITFGLSSSYKHVIIILASSIIKLASISFSNSYIENRIMGYDDYSNDFYIGLNKSSYMGFVYAK